MRVFFGAVQPPSQAMAYLSDPFTLTPLDPRLDIWQYGDGSLDWRTESGAYQVALAILVEVVENLAVAVLWVEPAAEYWFSEGDLCFAWCITEEEVREFIVDSINEELTRGYLRNSMDHEEGDLYAW